MLRLPASTSLTPKRSARRCAALARLPETTAIADSSRTYRLLWDLNHWLIRRPMSISDIVERLRTEVPERKDTPENELTGEAMGALVLGAALPDGIPGGLRLRVHRFIRGGWKFYRCVNPSCGRLFPKGEEQCSTCNHRSAPLYLCRNCGADYLRFTGDPDAGPLVPTDDPAAGPERMLYEPGRFDLPPVAADDDDDSDDADANNNNQQANQGRRGRQQVPAQIARLPVRDGSFDPATLRFSNNPNDFPLRATLAPGRTRCLCCGGTAGSRSVITPVGLGTSAAVKVLGEGLVESLSEGNRNRPGHDGKERLLGLQRQPARRRAPGAVHHLLEPLRPNAPEARGPARPAQGAEFPGCREAARRPRHRVPGQPAHPRRRRLAQ